MEQVFSAEYNYISLDGKQWVVEKGKMPLKAKTNSLQFSGLNLLELHLISLHVPFMKIVSRHCTSPLAFTD